MKTTTVLLWLPILVGGLLIGGCHDLCAQSHEQDSLRQVISAHKGDSLEVEALMELTWSYLGSDLDSSLQVAGRALTAAQTLSDLEQLAAAERNLGITRLYQGENQLALTHFYNALNYCEEIGDQRQIAGAVNNVAIALQELGNYAIALEFHQRGLQIKEELKDSSRIHISLNNIGLIYENLKDYTRAREYYLRSLNWEGAPDDSLTLATNYSNIGVTWLKEGRADSATGWFEKSLILAEGLGDKRLTGIQYLHYAEALQNQGKLKEAEAKSLQALQYFEELGKKDKLIDSWLLLGKNALLMGNAAQSKAWCMKSLELSREIEAVGLEGECLQCLSKASKQLGSIGEAFSYLENYQKIRDQLNAEELHRQVLQRDVEFTFQRQQLADSLESARQLELAEFNHQQEMRQWEFMFVLGGLVVLVLLLLTILFYRNYTQKNRLSQLLEEKVRMRTRELETKNTRLADYAFINAHLLRGPLAQIMGLVSLLQESPGREESEEYLRLLAISAGRLDKIIHEIGEAVESERVQETPLSERLTAESQFPSQSTS